MPSPGDSALLDPTPEALAERLLDLGDPDGALEVLDRALRRDPGSDRARALRSRAILHKRNEHALTPRPSVLADITDDLAEAFIQRGFLEEAMLVYRRVLKLRQHSPSAPHRAELLMRVLCFQLQPDADPRQRRAEELVAVGRLASALADYRMLAREVPDDAGVVGRANDLRMLVLGGETPARRTMTSADLTTAVGASPRAAASMLEEGKLEEALVELQRLALARPELSMFAEAGEALERLVASTLSPEASPGDVAAAGLPTRPVRQINFAEMHIRLGNLAAAAELCRGLVEQSPGDEKARERLEDLRTVLRFISQVRERRSADSDSYSKARSSVGEGAPAPDVPLRKARRSQELSGYASSDSAARVKSQPYRADEDLTAVVRPEDQAELYLRQGFLEKAGEIYRTLVVRHPMHLRFQERLHYIERRILERDGGPPVPSVADLRGADVETAADVGPDEQALTDRPTASPDDLVFPAIRIDERLEPGRSGEGDDKTPVSTPAFEDQPTGRDALSEGSASRWKGFVESGRVEAPTTLLAQQSRSPAPGLVRDSLDPRPAPTPAAADDAVLAAFSGEPDDEFGSPPAFAATLHAETVDDSGWGYGSDEPDDPDAGPDATAADVPPSLDEPLQPDEDERLPARPTVRSAPIPPTAEAVPDEPTADDAKPTLQRRAASGPEPAHSGVQTILMPQTSIPSAVEDGAVAVRQIFVVGGKG